VKYAQNDAAIAQIGPSIPVLLTSGDHDTTAPPSAAQSDLAYYKANCGCDVTQWIVPNTAHLFMVHTSLASWVTYVVNWLSAHGVPSTFAAAGTAPTTGRTGVARRRVRRHTARVTSRRGARLNVRGT